VARCDNTATAVDVTDFRRETIYFLITTRFYDGDPSNNFYCRDRIEFDTQGNPIDPHWRGDFKGLIERLDYIQELGFTAIWITPPIENRSGLDYHGYHGYDWTRIDPRLESPGATYQDLINAIHARGMKLIQDVVVNHSCQYGIRNKVWIDHLPVKYFVPPGARPGQHHHGPYRDNLGNYTDPFREDNDNPVAPAWFRERQHSDPEGLVPLVDPKTGVTVPCPGYNPGRFFGVDATTLDSVWYHQDGFICGGDWESASLQTKHLAGDCIDLNTEHPVVKEYLIESIKRYLDLGVDALRIDTVKHVERDNLLEYVNAWKAYKPSLFVFGENLVKGTGYGDLFGDDNGPSFIRPWWYTRLGHDERNPHSGGDSGFAVLDFGLFSTFRDNISRGHFEGLGRVFSRDYIYGNPSTLVTFLQNHDVGPDNDFRFRFKGETWMAAACYNLLWTVRGIPCLYYGEEIEFMKGAPQDVIGNNDTLSSTGRAYFGDHLSKDRIEQTKRHPLFVHLQRLNAIRRAIPALQTGKMSHVEEHRHALSFVRVTDDASSYVVVGLTIGHSHHFSIHGVRRGVYRDAVTGLKVEAHGDRLEFSVNANSAGIYVLNGPGKIGIDGPFLR
jgi:glycosidase